MIKKLLLLSTIILLNSCIKTEDYKDLSININTSLPLGDLTISEKKLFELASVGEGGFVYVNDIITFQGNSTNINFINSDDLKEVLKIKSDLNFTKDKNIDITNIYLTQRAGMTTVEIPKEANDLDLELDPGVEIDEALLSNGILSIFVEPVVGVDFSDLIFTINNFNLDGNPITTASNQGDQPKEIDLSGYNLTPNNRGQSVSIQYEGAITIDNSAIDLTLTSVPLRMNVKMMNIEVQEAKGFFGRQEFSPVIQDIDLGDNSSSDFFEYIDDFSIANPSISMAITSDVNIPILVRIDKIYSLSTINGTVVEKELRLKNQFNKNRFLIDSENNKIVIDNSIFEGNSVLSGAITKNLNGLKVNITPIANPTVSLDGIPESNQKVNEFNVNNTVNGDLIYSIPLSGYFKDINITDTLSMDIGSDEYNINEVSFAILAENTFPLDISLSLYSLDSNGTLVELSHDKIEIPSVVENNNPSSGSIVPGVVNKDNVTIITLDEMASDRFVNAEKILFKINASSMNPNDLAVMPTINFYKNSYLKMKMILGVKGDIEFNSEDL